MRMCPDSAVSVPHADTFVRRYRTALALVALLVLLNQVVVQPSLTGLSTDAPLLNLAGRQRMLSQRLAKSALILDRQRDSGRAEAREELRAVLALWSASHERLQGGGAGGTGTGQNSPAVQQGLEGLTPYYLRMRGAAQQLLGDVSSDRAGAPDTDRAVAAILASEEEYLERMDAVVKLYESEARGRVERLRLLGWMVAAVTLAALAAIGRLVLRPAVTLIRAQFAALAHARDDLEARVAERTGELETARQRHRELLDQLNRTGRSASIGEMASGLAHELNQPLGAIANYAEGCLIELSSPRPALDEVRGALERLRAATMRAGQIIDRVRRFVTRQAPSREAFEANALVAEVAEILEVEARRRRFRLALDLAPGLPCLWGDPVQIQQVIVNLVRNAFDAHSGTQAETPAVLIQTRGDGKEAVEFSVSDHGEGIPADRIDRIFDPYFSTRADGMGIGLAICRTIVEAHQGRLRVKSIAGVGTTFRFSIPTRAVGNEADAGTDGLHRG